MTFEEYMHDVFRRWSGLESPYGVRLGQIAFNALTANDRSDLADLVIDTHPSSNVDPYYNDANLGRFFPLVWERWNG